MALRLTAARQQNPAQTLHVAESTAMLFCDEVGKMELFCPEFVQAVPRLLEGPVLVVARVALRGNGLIAEVKTRSDVRMVRVTAENRDGLPRDLEVWARELASR